MAGELDIAIDIVPDEPKAYVMRPSRPRLYWHFFYQKNYALLSGQNALDDPKNSKMFCTIIWRILRSYPEVSILKTG